MSNEFQEKKLSRRSVTTIGAALILAVGVGYGLSLVGTGLSAKAGNSITVTGYAKTSAVADNAVWTLNISEMSQQVSVAVKKIGTSTDALSKYLIAGGLDSEAIEVGGVTTYANNEYVNGNSTGRIISYQANQNVTVRSKDVELVKKLSNGMGTLLQTGVNINNYGPMFYVSNLDKLRPQLLAEATVDAKDRGPGFAQTAIGAFFDNPEPSAPAWLAPWRGFGVGWDSSPTPDRPVDAPGLQTCDRSFPGVRRAGLNPWAVRVQLQEKSRLPQGSRPKQADLKIRPRGGSWRRRRPNHPYRTYA